MINIKRDYYSTKYSTLYEEIENILNNKKKEIIFKYSFLTSEFYKVSQAVSSFFTKHKLWRVLKLTRSYTRRVIIIKRRD